jgi:thymidylate synthase (FAD)
MERIEKKVLDYGFVALIDVMGNDDSIVQAARVSYGKGTKKKSEDRTLIRYLMRHRHTSPFEMVEFKFHCKMPIFCARQWIRHRTASLNECSGRYSEMPDECYIPEVSRIQGQDDVNYQASSGEQIEQANEVQMTMIKEQKEVFKNYKDYLGAETAREIARVNLPLSTYTQWYWKMDLHNLFHFLGLRMHPHAQWEMQKYAEAIFELIKPIVPIACEAFEDYIVYAQTFSRKEVDLLRSLVRHNPQMLKFTSLTKREKKEFCKKINWE